jgi:hypothetical protein
LLKEFVELFRGKTEEELDELAKSFLLSEFIIYTMARVMADDIGNCTQRDRLCNLLAEDAKATFSQ